MSATNPEDTRCGSLIQVGLLVIAALAGVLRLVALQQYERDHPLVDSPVIDEASYDTWAAELAHGDWLGREVFFQEPLYPYFLGVVYALTPDAAGAGAPPGVEAAPGSVGRGTPAQRALARRVQVVLGAATVLIVGWCTVLVFGGFAGLFAALALALHKPLLLFPALLLKPNLLLPLFALLVTALVKAPLTRGPGRWVWIGLLVGLCALLRGNALILIPVFLAFPVLRGLLERVPLGVTLRCSLALGVGVGLALAPVAARNLQVGGVLALTTSGAGTNVYGGNNADNPYGVATEFDWVRGVPEHEADDWRREAERRLGRELDAGEVSRYWLAETGRSLLAQPSLHARILLNKLRLSLGAFEVPDNHHLDWDARYVALLELPTGGFGLWGALGIAGLLLLAAGARGAWRRAGAAPPTAGLGLALLLAAYLATLVLTVVSMRARLPLMVLLAPFAGYFLVELGRAVRTRERLPASLLAAAAAALVVHVPVLSAESRELELEERDFNLAVFQYERGATAEAERTARALLERHPGTQRVRTLLATIESDRALESRRDGGGEPALAALRAALEQVAAPTGNARERFRASSLAGALLLELDRPEEALEALRAAREFDHEEPALRLLELRAEAALLFGVSLEVRAPVSEEAAEALLGHIDVLVDREPSVADPASLLRSEVAFAYGRVLLRRAREDEADVQRGRGLVRGALDGLRALVRRAGDEDLRFAARLAAARMQLDPVLEGRAAALRHLRAALVLRPDADQARLLLARSLWWRGEGLAGGAECEAELAEARALVQAALAGRAEPDPAWASLARELGP